MIDIYLCFHPEAGWYFAPREAVWNPSWRSRVSEMTPASEKFPGPLPMGHPSFEVMRGEYVPYATARGPRQEE
jgi:hypothetical protein